MSAAGLKAIFLERRQMMERLLRARTGSIEEAEDILQELWLRLEVVKPGPINDPAAYLFRTAMNLAIDRSISARRRRDREQAWAEVQPGSAEFPDQQAGLAAHQELARLQEHMQGMPANMVQALELFRLHGRSQREIAAHLGMSVSGVEKLLARAYRRLAEFQANNCADPAGQIPRKSSRNTSDAS